MPHPPRKPTTPAPAPRPVSSFGPELFAALIHGAKTQLVLRMPWKKAIRLRLRAQQLREAMRLADHPQYALVSLAQIGIELDPGTSFDLSGRNKIPHDRSVEVTFTISPKDSEFAELLQAAGVQIPDALPSATPSKANTKPLPEPGTLDSLFGKMKD